MIINNCKLSSAMTTSLHHQRFLQMNKHKHVLSILSPQYDKWPTDSPHWWPPLPSPRSPAFPLSIPHFGDSALCEWQSPPSWRDATSVVNELTLIVILRHQIYDSPLILRLCFVAFSLIQWNHCKLHNSYLFSSPKTYFTK